MFNTNKYEKGSPFPNNSTATPKLIAVTIFVVAFVAYLVLGAGISRAARPGGSGKALAIRYCSDCHEVAPDTPSLKQVKGATSFESIANDPNKSSESHLVGVMGINDPYAPGHSHSLMNVKAGGYLDSDQIQSILDYIRSLKPR